MNTPESELTIVIPAKNESLLLPRLLDSLCRQDYLQMRSTKVYVADAGSIDGTPDIALSYDPRLHIEVIKGGLPAVGRNAGAWLAETPYILFLDADIEVSDRTMVRRALELAKQRRLHCVTTNICCNNGTWRDALLYTGNNIMQYLSTLLFPFSTGMFMLFDRARFQQLGGFHEKALYAEDYLLSKKVLPWRFGIVDGSVLTTNRRFRHMGYGKVALLFAKTVVNSMNERHFLRDHGYWRAQT